MFANTTQFYQGYPQSQAPNTSGMNASQAPIPEHSHLNLPQPGPMTGTFDSSLGQEFSNGKSKRKQVKNACTNCQKACKKCDEQRPCPRCVKYGQNESCVDSVRKERQKGLKRGPYKKRKQGDGMEGDGSAATAPNMQVSPLPNGMYPTPTTGVAGDSRGAIAYQAYGNTTTHFENFPSFPNGQYIPYNILNSMNNMIQQAATNANANANANVKDPSQQQEGMDGGNNNNNDNKTSTEVDENGKLNILSQLCTAVLDRDPNTNESKDSNNSVNSEDQNKIKAETKPVATATTATTAASESTVSQSNTHSRESTATTITTNDNNNEPNASAAENGAESDDGHGSRYGTPETGEDQTAGMNN